MLHILFIGGSRFAWRVFRDRVLSRMTGKKRTLIIGAGAGGVMVARQLASSQESELRPVAFVDDDPKKSRVQILNVPVAGKLDNTESNILYLPFHPFQKLVPMKSINFAQRPV